LAEQLIDTTPDNSLTLFDRGFYSLGLLNRWHQTGEARHWLMPRVGAHFEQFLTKEHFFTVVIAPASLF
ncbi:hypothetical protein J3L11_19270, partial [Shewanella sp. 4t3-1-2LB]|nr:hypothetical protein [Shewanella sp. 4t3-1-2LB]